MRIEQNDINTSLDDPSLVPIKQWHRTRGIGHMIIGASKERPGVRQAEHRQEMRVLAPSGNAEEERLAATRKDPGLAMRHFLCQIAARGVQMNYSRFPDVNVDAENRPSPSVVLQTNEAFVQCDDLILDLSDKVRPFACSARLR